MPFALLIIGLLLVVSAVRNTQGDLFKLVIGDVTGKNNFVYWILTIFAIGMLGYIPRLKAFSTAFLVLIAVVILLVNKGFFDKFQEQIGATAGASQSKTVYV